MWRQQELWLASLGYLCSLLQFCDAGGHDCLYLQYVIRKHITVPIIHHKLSKFTKAKRGNKPFNYLWLTLSFMSGETHCWILKSFQTLSENHWKISPNLCICTSLVTKMQMPQNVVCLLSIDGALWRPCELWLLSVRSKEGSSVTLREEVGVDELVKEHRVNQRSTLVSFNCDHECFLTLSKLFVICAAGICCCLWRRWQARSLCWCGRQVRNVFYWRTCCSLAPTEKLCSFVIVKNSADELHLKSDSLCFMNFAWTLIFWAA